MKRGEMKLPLKTLEQIICTCPQFLEASLRNLLLIESKTLTAKTLWSDPKNAAIVRLASESADIFQAATSIMNEILTRSNLSTTIVNLIQTFIKGTKSIFKNDLGGFISLYPAEYQTLVMFLLLQKHTPSEAVESVVSNKLYKLVKDDVKAFVCLATHFPASSQSFQNLRGAPKLPV